MAETRVSETENQEKNALTEHYVHLEQLQTPENEDNQEQFAWNYDVITNLAALYMCFFASAWAMGVPATSLAFIMLEFPRSTATTTSWIATSPSLILCVLNIFLGDVSDILGRRWFLIGAMTSGVAGMLLGATASSVNMIIGGQVLNGIALTVGFLATPLLAEMVPKRARSPIVSGGTLLAGIVGIGGQLSQGAFMKYGVYGLHRGWRIGFFIGTGWFLIGLLAVIIFYHPGKRPNSEGMNVSKLLLQIDWIGVALGTAGLVLFLVGLQFGGNPDPWTSARVLAMMLTGILVSITFVIWEWKFVREGLFPHDLFQHRNFSITLALNFIEGMVIFSAQAFTSQMMVNFITEDLFLTAVYGIPSNIATALGAIAAGLVAAKTKEAKYIALTGVICLGVGAGLLAVMRPGINLAAWFVPNIVMGTGIGSLGTIIPVITTLCTPDKFIATSVSIGSTLRGLGGAIGLVAFTQIFAAKIKTSLPVIVTRAVISAGLPMTSVPSLLLAMAGQDPAAFADIPGVTPEILQALSDGQKQAYAYSFRFIWYAVVPFAAVAAFACFFLKSTKEQMTLQVASAVEIRHSRGMHQPKLDRDAKVP